MLRPYPGALETARRLRPISEGSGLVASHGDCGRVQDAYSLRCVPQVMGASLDALDHVERQLEIEFASVNDNPLVLSATGEVISAGHFHAQPVALVADYLKIAVAEIASLSERRIDRLLDARVSELPAALARTPGLESGYMLAQYTAAALVSENKVLAHPASVDSIPTGAGIEDHVSMAPIAGRHARQVVENAARVVAMELLRACRAPGIPPSAHGGRRLRAPYAAIRRLVPEPPGDRPLSDPCETIARWVLSRAPEHLAEEALVMNPVTARSCVPRVAPRCPARAGAGSRAPHADEQPRPPKSPNVPRISWSTAARARPRATGKRRAHRRRAPRPRRRRRC
jgi:histidine ammonia-lyase